MIDNKQKNANIYCTNRPITKRRSTVKYCSFIITFSWLVITASCHSATLQKKEEIFAVSGKIQTPEIQESKEIKAFEKLVSSSPIPEVKNDFLSMLTGAYPLQQTIIFYDNGDQYGVADQDLTLRIRDTYPTILVSRSLLSDKDLPPDQMQALIFVNYSLLRLYREGKIDERFFYPGITLNSMSSNDLVGWIDKLLQIYEGACQLAASVGSGSPCEKALQGDSEAFRQSMIRNYFCEILSDQSKCDLLWQQLAE